MVPEAWGVSLLTAIYKGKGDPAQPTNYRGIAVTCILAKVFSSVIEARLSTFLEAHGLRAAGLTGFRKNIGARFHISLLRHLQVKHSTPRTSPPPLRMPR